MCGALEYGGLAVRLSDAQRHTSLCYSVSCPGNCPFLGLGWPHKVTVPVPSSRPAVFPCDMRLLFATLVLALGATASVPYEQYILAPSSRTVRPTSVYLRSGSLFAKDALLDGQVSSGKGLTLYTFNSSVTYDFGKNIAGWINFNTTSTGGSVGFTFSESSMWVSSDASDGTFTVGDAPLVFDITGAGQYSPPLKKQRGGFRYVTVVNLGADPLSINDLWVHFTAMPHWEDDALRSYTGWFHSDNEKLNR